METLAFLISTYVIMQLSIMTMLILVFDTFVTFFLPCCVFICYKEVLASTSLSPGIF